jgi:lysophospholipase L1-like esterase
MDVSVAAASPSFVACSGNRREVVCFGDSITEQGWGSKGSCGWVAMLADAYRRRCDVVNRGFGGYTTRTLQPIVARAVAATTRGARFALATLFLGANDANAQPEQHVPVAEYGARLEAMAASLAGVADCVLVIGPGVVDNRRWPSRSNAAAGAYADAAREAAARAAAGLAAAAAAAGGGGPGAAGAILYVSFFEAATGGRSRVPEGSEAPLSVTALPELAWVDALSDGLHLSSAGNALLAGAVLRAVREGCPRAAPEAFAQPDFPHWSEISVGPAGEAEAFYASKGL